MTKLRRDIDKYGWSGILATALSSENRSYWQKAQQENYSFFRHLGRTHFIGAGATLFRRQVLLEHPFDSRMESLEDQDLCRRLVEANCPLGVSPAIVYHHQLGEFSAFVKHQLRDGRGNACLAFKYRSTWILISPLLNLVHVVIYGTLRGKVTLVPFWLTANILKFLGTISGTSKIKDQIKKAR
jgi:cellulose synthase/poly-beta-1,6-N-acetylglucosamine synthase-like glycosyltransferase